MRNSSDRLGVRSPAWLCVCGDSISDLIGMVFCLNWIEHERVVCCGGALVFSDLSSCFCIAGIDTRVHAPTCRFACADAADLTVSAAGQHDGHRGLVGRIRQMTI